MKKSTPRKLDDLRIGFILSHPFHFYIYRPLIKALKSPLAIIELRKNTPFEFSDEFIAGLGCKHVLLDETQLNRVDQQVDVIFAMTPKHLEANFKHAKVVVMQYGMAKEKYNYGLWRTHAALNMMYGPYSTAMVSGHAVARSIGNIRFDAVKPERLGGAGLLYLPTYGELSTLGKFADLLPQLNPKIPVRIKLHHASEFADKDIIAKLEAEPRVTLLDGYHDALDDIAAADVVLSDYSGAIFDAMFLERPVALFQPGFVQSVVRTTDKSIEIARGSELGEVLDSSEALIAFFDRLADGIPPKPGTAERSEFFSNPGNAVPAALQALDDLVNDRIKRTVVQDAIHYAYCKLLERPQIIGFGSAVKRRVKNLLFK